MNKSLPGLHKPLQYKEAQIRTFLINKDYFSSDELYHLYCNALGYQINRRYLGNIINKYIIRTDAPGIYKVL